MVEKIHFTRKLCECACAGRFMKEADKESFLSAFYEELPEGASLAGFCVLGGIFPKELT